jgi:hypothetical protein
MVRVRDHDITARDEVRKSDKTGASIAPAYLPIYRSIDPTTNSVRAQQSKQRKQQHASGIFVCLQYAKKKKMGAPTTKQKKRKTMRRGGLNKERRAEES